jgi:hypothetical protein
MSRPIVYSRDDLISALSRYAEILGEPPAANRLDRDAKHLAWLPSLGPFKREFGTWNKALEAAGIR